MYDLRIMNSQNEETFRLQGLEDEIIEIDIQSIVHIGDTLMIIDLSTGEVIAERTLETQEEVEEFYLISDDDDCCEDPDCLECGFDPYMGCYSDDC